MRTSLLLLPSLLLLAVSGCQQSAAPVLSVPTQQSVTRIDAPTIDKAAETPGDLIEETWDAYSMQGIRVGYAHTTATKVVLDGQTLIRTKSEIHISLQRSGQTVTQNLTLASWDTPDGKFVRFESQMNSGGGDVAAVGAVRGRELGIDSTTLGRTESEKIPWQSDWGGLFAPDQSLRKQPLKPGEKRTIRSLSPIGNIAADTHFEALDYEMVEMPLSPPTRSVSEGPKTSPSPPTRSVSEAPSPTRSVSESPTQARSASEGSPRQQRLLKLNSTMEFAGQKIESLAWMNDEGELVRTLIPGLQQEVTRTTKEDALQHSDQKFDLLVSSTVPLQGTFVNPHTTKRAVYRARVKNGQIAGLFSNGLSQRVKPIDEQTAEITVLAIRPGQPPKIDAGIPVPSPTNGDLATSNFIQTDDALIAQMAANIVPDQRDPWKISVELEKFVGTTVENKNFSTAFATAAEVARSLEGDCTEHAVLLAALCRARKIPARTAFGLVYYPPERGFAYHMWNEVWIHDRWIPLDATLMLSGIGADHIKLGDSNLSGGSPLTDLLSVVQVLGRLDLELVETE